MLYCSVDSSLIQHLVLLHGKRITSILCLLGSKWHSQSNIAFSVFVSKNVVGKVKEWFTHVILFSWFFIVSENLLREQAYQSSLILYKLVLHYERTSLHHRLYWNIAFCIVYCYKSMAQSNEHVCKIFVFVSKNSVGKAKEWFTNVILFSWSFFVSTRWCFSVDASYICQPVCPAKTSLEDQFYN